MRIVGDNIILRTVEKADSDLLLKWENHPETHAYNTDKSKYSKEDIENFIDGNHDIHVDKQLRLMIIQESSMEAIGTLDLFEFDDKEHTLGIGILIFEDKNRRRGYASEAMDIGIRYSSKHLLIKKIFCNIDPSNEKSIKFFKSKGFRKENRDNVLLHFDSKRLAKMDFYLLDLLD
ncbi:MAG: diamine N-acetyltransferase [Patiriisocius sp.]|jgi:diamine N-acetyltransferase